MSPFYPARNIIGHSNKKYWCLLKIIFYHTKITVYKKINALFVASLIRKRTIAFFYNNLK